jgi:hypothetical protein
MAGYSVNYQVVSDYYLAENPCFSSNGKLRGQAAPQLTVFLSSVCSTMVPSIGDTYREGDKNYGNNFKAHPP